MPIGLCGQRVLLRKETTMTNDKYNASLDLVNVAYAELTKAFDIIRSVQGIMSDAKRELPMNDGTAMLNIRHNVAQDQIADLIQSCVRADKYVRDVSALTYDKIQRSKEVAK